MELVWDDRMGAYDFGRDHPFQIRYRAEAAHAIEAERRAAGREDASAPVAPAEDVVLARFHTDEYRAFVRAMAAKPGRGLLDGGDTPSFPGCDVAAARIVGGTVLALETVASGARRRAFAPGGGLHHAHPDRASGFCIFNDAAIAIATALRPGGPYRKVAYVDMDAHHGDGVMYGFYGDGRVLDIDVHQDGRTLFPGTGAVGETGSGDGAGLKVNLPLPPGAGDGSIGPLIRRVAVPLLREFRPELLVVQHGVDGHAADPLAALEYSDGAYADVLGQLVGVAEELGGVPMLVTGGGGYDRDAVARVFTSAARILEHGPPHVGAVVAEEPWVETTTRSLERELGRTFPPGE
ncbi:MAG: acetoin utilization protein AcuC [Thermoplasmata archaeon]|nr:acetoin utilization protein AcuC [Thermoplasmata archaeon]